AGAHDLADADRRDVALAFVHPAAHCRIEREQERLDEDAAGLGRCDRLGREGPVGARRQADRTSAEADQSTRMFAACRPFWPCLTSNSTRWFSCSVLNPEPWMSRKWAKRSAPPESWAMKPKPLASLNHFTVPV